MGVFFASHPDDRVVVYGKGASNDKSYADLNGVCRENCMVVQRDKNANSSGNGTLVFVSQSLYGNHDENNGWFFTEIDGSYCAIKPATGGYTLSSIAGQPPSMYKAPVSCSFAPRCPHAFDRCHQEVPELRLISPGHKTACFWDAQTGEPIND